MNLTKQESALIGLIRTLCFEDLLDATHGIYNAKQETEAMSYKLAIEGNQNAAGFKKRAEILGKLAEHLGDANDDYRRHINPEMSGIIQMIESNAGEVFHLFDVMKKYGVTCSLEFNTTKSLNPLLGLASVPVKAEYLEGGEEGDSVIVHMGEAEFSFDLKNHSFSKYVNDCQIDVLIAGDEHACWFSSGLVPPAGIAEAINYDDSILEE